VFTDKYKIQALKGRNQQGRVSALKKIKHIKSAPEARSVPQIPIFISQQDFLMQSP
jgi:hypothetical protein